jgi:hypothetical protein
MTKKKETPESLDGVLVTAAKTIGEAAGKLAAAVGVKPLKPKVPKLVAKKQTRVPRRQKKAAKRVLKRAAS